MKHLDNVTLLTADGLNPELCRCLLNHCCEKISFEKVKLISFKEPERDLGHIQFHQIPQFKHDVHVQTKGLNDYNEFIVDELYKYIDTEFVLTVQTDGFISHPSLWDDEFFKYDYIGSPWSASHLKGSGRWVDQQVCDSPPNFVGNGGFSLRSKKMLELAAACPRELEGPEDVYCCLNNYEYFTSRGIKYAPVEVAKRFSQDNNGKIYADTFGFHGNRTYIHEVVESPHPFSKLYDKKPQI